MMTAYYNEIDPYAAQWLRNLIKAGRIAQGVVDERSITDVRPEDLKGFTQCHFFAGIGVWSHALRLAGWPDDRPVWTGSCPCQPFSSAGKQKGKEDERHLWPVWFNLISQSRPPVVFGEQVFAAVRHHWWDDVADDLEREGYTARAQGRPACGSGAPHRRERLWFVADTERVHAQGCEDGQGEGESGRDSEWYGNVADTNDTGSQGHGGFERQHDAPGRKEQVGRDTQNCFWNTGQWIDCPDGKQRLIEPSIRLLADGTPNRVGKLRAYGNAIVPQAAADFIRGYGGSILRSQYAASRHA